MYLRKNKKTGKPAKLMHSIVSVIVYLSRHKMQTQKLDSYPYVSNEYSKNNISYSMATFMQFFHLFVTIITILWILMIITTWLFASFLPISCLFSFSPELSKVISMNKISLLRARRTETETGGILHTTDMKMCEELSAPYTVSLSRSIVKII